jgi:hypothetical protein
MKKFSKTGKSWSHDYEFKTIAKITEAELCDDVVYYHHPYDSLMEKVPLHNALDSQNWHHINTNATVKLIHENSSETFDVHFARDVLYTLQHKLHNPKQLEIIVMDENHKSFLENFLTKNTCPLPNISVNNYLLNQVSLPDTQNAVATNKFSILSRNYREWRLFLYYNLLQKDLLKDFTYSFFNIWPYGKKVYNWHEMADDLLKLGVSAIDKKTKRWLKSCPHELDDANNVRNKWSNVTYDAINSADIHIIVETHFDQSMGNNSKYDRMHAPTSITEKTYKAIACKRPFFAFATPYFLEDLKKLGFKTFHPYIDETYDTIEDNFQRTQYIVKEVERICNLSETDRKQLLHNVSSVVEYNYNLLRKKQDK